MCSVHRRYDGDDDDVMTHPPSRVQCAEVMVLSACGFPSFNGSFNDVFIMPYIDIISTSARRIFVF